MNSLLSIRRWGVAALASVTLLGGVMVIGEGIASAAPPAFTSVVGSGSSAIAATATSAGTGVLTITLGAGTYSVGDVLVVCSTTAGATLTTVPVVTGTGTTTGTETATAAAITTLPTNVTGCANSTAYSITNGTAAWISGQTLILTPKWTTTSVTEGTALTVLATADSTAPATYTAGTGVANTGTIDTIATGVGAVIQYAPTTATVGAANSAAYTSQLVTNGVAPVTFATGSATPGLSVSASGKVTTTGALATGTYVNTGSTVDNLGSTGNWTFSLTVDAITQIAPTTGSVSVGGSAAFTAQLLTTGQGAGETFTKTAGSGSLTTPNAGTGLISTTGALGVGTYTISGTDTDTAGDTGIWTFTLSVGVSSAAIYGQTLDNTASATFEHLGCSPGANKTVVLATDALPYDSLAAAPLESALTRLAGGTIANGKAVGLLITPPTSLDPSMLQALNLEGVNTIYVVGGSLAITPADITALLATPVTTCGGVSTTQTMSVVGPFFGPTADDTALAIDTEANGLDSQASATQLPSLAAVTPTMYNNTLAAGSATGQAANNTTAILVADTDFQDSAAAAGIAYKYQLPVILTPGAALGSQAVQALTSLGITQVLAIGGQLALQPAVETAVVALGIKVVPIAGLDGSDSSTQLAKFEQGAATKGLVWASTTVLLAQGLAVSDALGAGVLSGLSIVPEPLLLTEAPNATAATDLGTSVIAELGLLGAGGVTNIQPLGGPLAVPANAIALAVTSL